SVLGLAFKPGTDDMRESPAIKIVNELIAAGSNVNAFDPVARSEAEKVFDAESIVYGDAIDDVIADADVLLILTRWELFNDLPDMLGKLDKQPLVIDARRMLDSDAMQRYDGIGFPN
ncbi:MAG: UDP binding domain-containing protein, partial [Woeseiaceae bacterium]